MLALIDKDQFDYFIDRLGIGCRSWQRHHIVAKKHSNLSRLNSTFQVLLNRPLDGSKKEFFYLKTTTSTT